MIEIVQGKKKL